MHLRSQCIKERTDLGMELNDDKKKIKKGKQVTYLRHLTFGQLRSLKETVKGFSHKTCLQLTLTTDNRSLYALSKKHFKYTLFEKNSSSHSMRNHIYLDPLRKKMSLY